MEISIKKIILKQSKMINKSLIIEKMKEKRRESGGEKDGERR